MNEDLFKSLVWDLILKAVIDAICAAVPLLAFPPVKWILSFLITKFTDQFYEAVKLQIDMQSIIIKNAEHLSAYNKASATLKIIAHDKGIDSEEFKNARENAKLALSKFVRFA